MISGRVFSAKATERPFISGLLRRCGLCAGGVGLGDCRKLALLQDAHWPLAPKVPDNDLVLLPLLERSDKRPEPFPSDNQ
jgi:hypothetical protein